MPGPYDTPPVAQVQQSMYEMNDLSQKATALAFQMEMFVRDVATNTKYTHDGKPRGMNWTEGHGADAQSILTEADRLYSLADLWDRG